MQTTEIQDNYGNLVKTETWKNGKSKRITFPASKYAEFEFLGAVYSVNALLYGNQPLKEYYKYSDSEAVLQRDRYGRLWLYFYDYYSDLDRTDYLWAVVADEADADELVKVYRLSRLREPYIAYDGEGWQAAHERVNKKSLEKM